MSEADDTRDAVEDRLTFDPDVDASDITVKNLNGEMVLNGTVPSYPQYMAAGLTGVRSVTNNIQILAGADI